MLKRLLKVLLAGTVGFLTIIAGYVLLGLHPGSGPISNERLVGLLLLPIPIGGAAGWAVYRLLDGAFCGRACLALHRAKRGRAPRDVVYDRTLLLGEAKRNAVLELWEVERYGQDSFGNVDYVSLYGLRPADWYAKGVRVLGRTAVECTRDELAAAIARDIAAIVGKAQTHAGSLVIDPFVGSANTLHWILRALPAARGLGFELDERVFALTRQNVATLNLSIDIVNTDYRSGIARASARQDELLVAFIAPPWGQALDHVIGLDTRRTTPPVGEILDVLFDAFPGNRWLCAVQVFEVMNPASVIDLEQRFEWSSTHRYQLNAPGRNHGVMLGTRRWVP